MTSAAGLANILFCCLSLVLFMSSGEPMQAES